MSFRSLLAEGKAHTSAYLQALPPNSTISKRDIILMLASKNVVLSTFGLDQMMKELMAEGKLKHPTMRTWFTPDNASAPELTEVEQPGLLARVHQLEDDVADLRSQLAALRQRLI